MFNLQLKEVQKNQEDFEWYPTTSEIIACLIEKIKSHLSYYKKFEGFLDIGAGNGKVLDAVSKESLFSNYFAIEKSQTLLGMINHKILGVDFWQTTLLDKKIDFIFSNPPYSEFEPWSEKIIEEAPEGATIYLVVPQRWSNSVLIKNALYLRHSKAEIVDSFDFLSAEDRKARAKVDLLEIIIKKEWKLENDPFKVFFDKNFSYPEPPKEDELKSQEESSIVAGMNFIEKLCFLYESRINKLMESFHSICKIDFTLLKEFEISKSNLVDSMKMKIDTAKKEYWRRLFDNMDDIKKRLTYESRSKILSLMNDQTGIDFNRENCYAILFWIIKHANEYFNDQFISVYEKMIDYANIENYVSNKRVFREHDFHYNYCYDKKNPVTHIKIKTGGRIVLENSGGLSRHQFLSQKGLSDRAAKFIGDVMTIAGNFGYILHDNQPKEYEWDGSASKDYFCTTPDGETACLFSVRAFYNGNMHFQFLPDFVHQMNIQYGKLKGWLSSSWEAEEEIGVERDLAQKSFKHDFNFKANEFLALK